MRGKVLRRIERCEKAQTKNENVIQSEMLKMREISFT